MIIWFTGQPGAGKSTLAAALKEAFARAETSIFHFDGDALRQMTNNQDYSEAGRRRNVHNAAVLALAVDCEDVVVICTLVSPYRDQRERLKRYTDVLEIYVHGHEDAAKTGFCLENYEPPLSNFIDVDTRTSLEACIDTVFAAVVNKMAANSEIIDTRHYI
jgi:phosphoribulokinase